MKVGMLATLPQDSDAEALAPSVIVPGGRAFKKHLKFRSS